MLTLISQTETVGGLTTDVARLRNLGASYSALNGIIVLQHCPQQTPNLACSKEAGDGGHEDGALRNH